jgi:flagellar hook capping protein FlgD/MAM domain-containing protein meprin/A5/mu
MKKGLFILTILMFTASFVFASISIGDGTLTNKAIPIEPYYGYTYSQVIYLQSEINDAGLITEVSWDFAGTSLSSSNDWTIYMGHTAKTQFDSNTDWIDVTTLTEVWSGTFPDPGAPGLITFNTGFSYNNIDNLVIAVDENCPSYNGYSDQFYCTAVTNNRGIRYYNDSTNPDPANPPTAGYGSPAAFIANIVLEIVDPGFIEGTVTLDASGNVEDVVVSAGGATANPDATGAYVIGVAPGTYDVIASVAGYDDGTVTGVVVAEAVSTPGVDFDLIHTPDVIYPPTSLYVDEFGYATWNVPGPIVDGWLFYHDDTFEGGLGSAAPGGAGIAQMFQPAAYPCTIEEVEFFVSSAPDQEEEVWILADDGFTVLGGPYTTTVTLDWNTLDIDDIVIDGGGFMIATYNVTEGGPYIGYDTDNYNGTLYFGDHIGGFTELGVWGYYGTGSHGAYVTYGIDSDVIAGRQILRPVAPVSEDKTQLTAIDHVSNTTRFVNRNNHNSGSRSLITYDVYLDGDLVVSTEDLFYHYYNLEDGIEYSAEVIAVFDDGDSDPAMYDFTAVVYPAPFAEGFDVWPPANWDMNEGTVSWVQFADPACAEASFYGQSGGNTDIMITPPVDISLIPNPTLYFDWSRLQYYAAEDAMNVAVTNDFVTWTTVWEKSGADLDSGDGASFTSPGSFVTEALDLADYSAAGPVFVRFTGTSAYGSDLFVDNVMFETAKPENLTATATDSMVKLTWDVPFGLDERALTGYSLYKKTDGEFELLNTVTETFYTDVAIDNMTAYTYAVRADYDAGQSLNSNEMEVVPMEAQELPYSTNFDLPEVDFFAMGDWERGTPTIVGPDSAYSDDTCWGTVLDTTYTIDTESVLMKAFDLSYLADGAKINFYYYLDTASPARVLVDGDNDGNYDLLETLPVALEWTEAEIIISQAQCSKYTRIVLHLDAGATAEPGFYMDNFAIQAYNPAEFDVTPPALYAVIDTLATYSEQLTVFNPGGEDVIYSGVLANMSNLNPMILEESFEDSLHLSGWTIEQVVGTTDWTRTYGVYTTHPAVPHSGDFNAYFNGSSGDISKLVSPQMVLGSATGATLTFWHAQEEWLGDQDVLKVYYKDSAAGTWTLLEEYLLSVADWTERTIALPSLSDDYYVAFEGVDAFGYGVGLDDVTVQEDANWLAIADTTFSEPDTLAAGGSKNFDVDFTAGTVPGTYTGEIVFTHDAMFDLDYPTVIVPVTMTVGNTLGDPIAEILPNALEVTLLAGETQTEEFTISNIGDPLSILSYRISEYYTTPDSRGNSSRENGSAIDGEIHTVYSEVLRSGETQRQRQGERIENWLTITPVEGECEFDETDVIEVAFNGVDIFPGNYLAEIEVAHNGSNSPETILVSFTVVASAGHPPLGTLFFESYITARPGDILDEASANCSYSEQWEGFINVQVGNFTADWVVGDTLMIDAVEDVTGFIGSAEIVLDDELIYQTTSQILLAPHQPVIDSYVATGSIVSLDWVASLDLIIPDYYYVYRNNALIDTVYISQYDAETADGVYEYQIKCVFVDVYGDQTLQSAFSAAVEVVVNGVREQPANYQVATNSAYITWDTPVYAPVADTLQEFVVYLFEEVADNAYGKKSLTDAVGDTLQVDTLAVDVVDYQFNQSTLTLGATYTAGIEAYYLSGVSERLDSTFVYVGPPASENFVVDADHAYITWDTPTGTTNDTLSYYEVYLDGAVLDTLTLDILDYQFDQSELTPDSLYTAGIKAGYVTMNGNMIETALQELEFVYGGPSTALAFEVNESGFAIWNDPAATPTDVLTYYKLYLDDVEVDEITVGDPRFQYEQEDLVDGVAYLAGIKAGYLTIYGDFIESAMAETGFTFITPMPLPPVGLTARAENVTDVVLNWSTPPEELIQYQDGFANNGIGNAGDLGFTTAARFTNDELSYFYGKELSHVNFVIQTEDEIADYTQLVVKVWEVGADTTLIRSEDATSLVLDDEWTIYELNDPVNLIEGYDYWIGYYIETTEGHPAGVDDGPEHPNGAWINYTGEWMLLSESNPIFNYNWCLQGYISAGDGEADSRNEPVILTQTPTSYRAENTIRLSESGSMNSENNRNRFEAQTELSRGGIIEPDGYNVYRDGSLITPILVTSTTYTDVELLFGTYEYYVKAVYGSNEGEACRSIDVGVYALDPATNLAVDPITGIATWDAPVSTNVTGYNVYLDDELVGDQIPDATFTYSGLAYGTTYVSMVDVVFNNGGISESIELAFTTLESTPPSNLFVDELGYATWETPDIPSDGWLYYHDGTFEGGLASTNGGAGMAQMFQPLLYPCTIEQVEFFVTQEGVNGQETEVWILADDGVTVLGGPYISDGILDWVTIDIDDIEITSGGFMVATYNVLGSGPYIGRDTDNYNATLYFGNHIDGFTELGLYGAQYESMGSHGAYVVYGGGSDVAVKRQLLKPIAPSNENLSNSAIELSSNQSTRRVRHQNTDSSRDLIGYNVYLDGVLVGDTTGLFWQYEDLTALETYLAEVTAVYDEGESDPIEYTFVFTPPTPPPTVLFSEYIEGSGNNKALEIWNNTGGDINLDNFRINQASNGGGWEYQHYFTAGATVIDGDVWVIITDQTDPLLFDPANADEVLGYPSVVHFNGNDARGLEWTPDGGTTWILLDVIGNPDEDIYWDVAGVLEATHEYTLVRKTDVLVGTTDWIASAGTNADDSEWVVYPQNTFTYLGEHPSNPIVLDPPTNLFVTETGYATWDAPSSGGGGTVQVDPFALDYGTGSTNETAKTATSMINLIGDTELGWAKFDISAIAAGTTIDSLRFFCYVNDTNYPYWSVTPLADDPVTADAATLWTNIIANETEPLCYSYNNEASTFAPGDHSYPLVNTAVADFEAALAQGWFAVGCVDRDSGVTYFLNIDGWGEDSPPYIEVYSAGERFIMPAMETTKKNQYATDDTRELTGYNVYLDGLNPVFTTDVFYQHLDTLTPGQEYITAVEAVYDEGISAQIAYTWIAGGGPNPFNPPENVMVDDETGLVSWTPPSTTISSDDFDSYTVGGYVAEQGAQWTTWSNLPGTSEDTIVSDAQAASPSNSMLVELNNDMVYIMEDYTTGIYSMDIDMYVPDGYCGYYNMQKTTTPGEEWGFQAYFQTDGHVIVDAGAAAAIDFNFLHDEWFDLRLVIDLDSDLCSFYFNGEFKIEYQWTLGTFGTAGLNQLGGMNIFGGANSTTTDTPMFYVDNVEFTDLSAPVDALTGYNVYLDDGTGTVLQGYTTDEFYQLENLVVDQTYMAGVTAVYDDPGESDMIEYEFTYVPPTVLPPNNLQAEVVDYNSVELTWELPGGDTEELSYCGPYDNNGIGTGAAADFICCARFTADELADFYGGWSLTGVNVNIHSMDFSYVGIQVYEGGSVGDPGTLVYDQDITASVVAMDWTPHLLSTPVPLVAGNEYWIGYDINATGDHPAAVDAGPMVPGKGAWMYFSGAWQELLELGATLDFNWIITGVVSQTDEVASKGTKKSAVIGNSNVRERIHTTNIEAPFEAEFTRKVRQTQPAQTSSRSLAGYKVYRDGVEIEEISDPAILNFTDIGLDADDYEYYVTAIYTNPDAESGPSNLVDVEITLPAPIGLNGVSNWPNILCTWTPMPGVLSYNLYRDGVEVENTTSTFYLDPNVDEGTYTYNVAAVFNGGYEGAWSPDVIVEHSGAGGILVPLVTSLDGNYPNPFNPTTMIKFGLHEDTKVAINVYNIKGEKVRTLVNGELEAAYHSILWNGKDDSGKTAASGVYFYKMKAGKFVSTKKMILMK